MNKIITLLLYFFTLLVSLYIARKVENHNKENNFKTTIFQYVLIFLPFILIASLRYNVGADYQQYIDNFYYLVHSNDKIEFIFSNKEPLYVISEYISLILFGTNGQFWIAMMACLTMFFILLSIKKISDNEDFNIYVFIFLFGLYCYVYLFNFVRQMFALSVILYAFTNYYYGNKKTFYILILLMFFYHRSSILFIILPLYYYIVKNWNKNIYLLLITLSPLLCFTFIPIIIKYVPFLSNYYEDYNFSIRSLGIGWIIDALPILLLNFTCYENGKTNIFMDISFLVLPIRFMAYFSFGLGRLFINFALFAIFGFSMLFNQLRRNDYLRIFIMVMFVGYFVLQFYIFNNSEVFPYNFYPIFNNGRKI